MKVQLKLWPSDTTNQKAPTWRRLRNEHPHHSSSTQGSFGVSHWWNPSRSRSQRAMEPYGRGSFQPSGTQRKVREGWSVYWEGTPTKGKTSFSSQCLIIQYPVSMRWQSNQSTGWYWRNHCPSSTEEANIYRDKYKDELTFSS